MSSVETRYKVAHASVFAGGSEVAWVVTETPSEVAAMIEETPDGLIKLTLANRSDWNNKPLFVRSSEISAISPPHNVYDE